MDVLTAVVALGAIITVRTCGLLELWLRSRIRREEIRDRYLTRMSKAVARGGRLEFDEQGGASHHMHVKIVGTPASQRNQAA
ncbi:hypothetical protein [Streptosporangium carneum]|uniref:Uncharacterized protein n=1 Tax=Streptosporangium carneum TaxID=47481 RepID=A0A9W6I8R5_9ACTN|nr:hypothetical protein [Streptosporangium carneum]GLK13491.1 hypothetical protein GCM10017600_69020 [Streptosporangium carneum]